MSRSALARLVLIIVILAGIAAVATHWSEFSVDAIEGQVDAFGPWAPLLFIAIYCFGALFFVPATLFILAAGVLFGPLWGAVYGLIGASLGASLAFLLSRYIAANWIAARSGPRMSRIIDGVTEEGWRFVALTRLVPIFPFAPLNYLLGISRIPFAHYLIASIIFMTPSAIAYTWLGHIGMEAASGRSDWVKFGLLGLMVVVLIVFLPRIIKRFRR